MSASARTQLIPPAAGAAGLPARIGRFEVRRLLGRGAQSSVYLGFDPHLEREVAIKTLGRDAAQGVDLLNEARTVGKLRHPNIVPVFEAGEQDGQVYLVFEFVEGRTLERVLREDGALSGLRAAELLSGVLDALEEAHGHGVVHRDLKPSNVLVGAQGLPRVMDFGIATRQFAGEDGDGTPLRGTPAYLAPEYIAQRVVTPQGDVFAAGLMLYEMVLGCRAVQAASVFEALHRIANEDLGWPPGAEAQVDEKLRGIIATATARDPRSRFQSAAEMRAALDDYLMPLPDAPGGGPDSGKGTLDFLLRRMRHKTDFPSMSASVTTITRLASSEGGDVNTLSNSILKDFALTNKILRIANSAYYRQFSSGGIGTVSRAIVVLGFNTVRNIAMSLLFLDHLQNKPHAERLREEFLRVSLSGMLARRLADGPVGLEPEESFICAQFHQLGRLLTHYYFAEEAEAIERLAARESCGEEAASARVLGIGYQDLGLGIARNWGFPESIVQSMYRLPPGRIAAAKSKEERLRALSGYANELCAAVEADPRTRAAVLARLRSRYGDCLSIGENQVAAAVENSIGDLAELARIVHVDFARTRIGKSLMLPAAADSRAAGGVSASRSTTGDVLAATAVGATVPPASGQGADGRADEAAAESEPDAVLAGGIQDISNALLEERPLGSLLGIALEIMYRALRFQRVLLCMRDGRSGTMCARFGLGRDADEMVPRFRFPLTDRQSIFGMVLNKDVDVLISDASEAKIAPYIPEWHRRGLAAQSFLLLPLRVRGVPVALIYADKDEPGSIVISPRQLGLLRTLRNQVLLAIKQSA